MQDKLVFSVLQTNMILLCSATNGKEILWISPEVSVKSMYGFREERKVTQ